MIKPVQTIDVMVMRIVTRFTTVDEFVSAFRTFCGEGSCFIPSAHAKRIGIETGFSIRLADGTPMLRGLCVVLDSWATSDNPYERPGVRLGIRSLTAESKPVFQRLLLAGAATKPREDEQSKATVEMAPLFPEERAPHSELILPANPLTAMSDESLAAFVDCMMFEDSDAAVVGTDAPQAIPEAIDAGTGSGETHRLDDDRNDPTTRRVEITQRLVDEASPAPVAPPAMPPPVTPPVTPFERALAMVASSTLRLDGGTQRIEKLESPQAKAQDLANEHADGAFGPMLAKAAERIQPVADHTQPTRMAFEVAVAHANAPLVPAAPILPVAMAEPPAVAASARPTFLGVAPIAAAPRGRISMPAIADPTSPSPIATPFPAPPAEEAMPPDLVRRPGGLWWRITTRLCSWYKKLVWARHRRTALRG